MGLSIIDSITEHPRCSQLGGKAEGKTADQQNARFTITNTESKTTPILRSALRSIRGSPPPLPTHQHRTPRLPQHMVHRAAHEQLDEGRIAAVAQQQEVAALLGRYVQDRPSHTARAGLCAFEETARIDTLLPEIGQGRVQCSGAGAGVFLHAAT